VSRRPRTRTLVVVGIAVSLLLAGVLSWYASSSPDGLNRVAQDHGFSVTEGAHASSDSPLAGYGTKGVGDSRVSGGVAGVIGVAVTGVVMGGLVLLLRRRSASRSPAPQTSPTSPTSPPSPADVPDTDR
jgi:hypothetical protein